MKKFDLDIVSNDETVERMGNEVYVQAGNYCRAFDTIETELSQPLNIIEKGEVLLISKLKYVQDTIHSVVVRPHPRHYVQRKNLNEYHFLFEDFLDKFELVSREEGMQIRNLEMKNIQDIIQKQQEELFKIQSNPELMMSIVMDIYSRRIEHKDNKIPTMLSGDVDAVALIEYGVNPELIKNITESLQKPQYLISIQAEWLRVESEKIQKRFEEILPYITEMAQAQASPLDEVKADLEKRLSGIATLELYLGNDVDVYTISEGNGADQGEKLTLLQEVLFADAELSLFRKSAVYFDANQKGELWDELRNNPKFVDQIFPTQRCVVLMRCNYKGKDYGNAYENYLQNLSNLSVFLLVRNGQNLYAVYSPISSHLHSSKLFPSKNEIERHLFEGREKIQINIDDLAYSDKLDEIEKEILHYKRFMLLIAGLDHRSKLFGDFYPQDEFMTMFYPEFQNKYFNFIHDVDGEGLLPLQEEKRPTLSEFFEIANRNLTVGSRVVVSLNNLINVETAPSCYSDRYSKKPYQNYRPKEAFIVTEVKLDQNGAYIKVPVDHSWDSDKRSFEARVSINGTESTYNLICLDTVTLEDINFYIHSRKYRKDFLQYLGMFKYAEQFMLEREFTLAHVTKYLLEALNHIEDCDLSEPGRKKAVLQAINTVVVHSKNGIELLNEKNAKYQATLNGMLKQLYFRASPIEREKHQKYVDDLIGADITPLKLSVDAKGILWLYSEITAQSSTLEVEPNRFVERSQLNITKTGKVSLKPHGFVLINQFELEEYDVVIWSGAKHYMNAAESWCYESVHGGMHDYKFYNYESKQEFTKFLEMGKSLIRAIWNQLDFDVDTAKLIIDAYFTQLKYMRDQKIGHQDVSLCLPIALIGKRISFVSIKNAAELTAVLIDKFNLQDYLAEAYNYHLKKHVGNREYQIQFSVHSATANTGPTISRLKVYKKSLSLLELLVGHGCFFIQEIKVLDGVRAESTQLISCYIPEIIKDALSFGATKKVCSEEQQLLKKGFHSSFTMTEFLSYSNLGLDKVIDNPNYKDTSMRDMLVLISSLEEIETKKIIHTKMFVLYASSERLLKRVDEIDRGFDVANPKLEHVVKSYFGVKNIVSFRDAELWFKYHVEKTRNSFMSWNGDDYAKKILNHVNVTSLSDLTLTCQNDDYIEFYLNTLDASE